MSDDSNSYITTSPAQKKQLILDGHWEFRQSSTEKWYDAKVPGNNFSDLKRSNLIEDPFFRTNEDEVQWVEKENWEYLKEFELSAEELEYGQINLVFEGLDTYANVYLNGVLILEANNMFVEWTIEVRDKLQEGKNDLKIIFESPISKVRAKAKKSGILYPAGNDHSEENLSVFSRKAPYHYGWDWGPRFVCSGIWRSTRLEFYNRASIGNVHVRQNLDENRAMLSANLSIFALESSRATIKVSYVDQQEEISEFHCDLCRWDNSITVDFEIQDYKKWWPRPLGEPHLYEITFSLSIDGYEIDSKTERIGLRKLEVINEPDEEGTSFYFKVNDVALFAKGANYIPQDSFQEQVTEKRYIQLFDDAINANMNMLRVWGGGIYEEDLFYELADKKGILIWQDFMFACTMYPGDEDFLMSIEEEAVSNIKRLRNHPSIAIWCGNNEIEVGWKHWGWQEEFNYSEQQQQQLALDYKKVFDELLPEKVRELDPDRFYFGSSPISYFEDSESFKVGDNHYWGVWHKEAPFEDFEVSVPRFMSEYGFQSFPMLSSLKKYSVEEDWSLDSDVMMLHQKHPRGNQLIKSYLLRDYKEPKNFESFLYASQVLQAEGIKMGIEAHRRNMPFCMGTLYWQLNDCWPVASWSSIDYYGNWKALHYKVKASYSDVLICATIKDKVEVFIVSDLLDDLKGVYTIEIKDFNGKIIFSKQEEVVIDSCKSKIYSSGDTKTLLSNHNPNEAFLNLKLEVNDEVISSNTYYFVKPKDLNLKSTEVNYSITYKEGRYEVCLTSKDLVKNLYLEFDRMEGNFSDNFFDLLPGEEKTVHFKHIERPASLPSLHLFSLKDMSK